MLHFTYQYLDYGRVVSQRQISICGLPAGQKEAGSSTWGAWADATLHARWARDGEMELGCQVKCLHSKEWVAGDRHRNSSEIIDYIYVRGTSSATSYWYQLIASTDIEGIVAGAPPSGG